MVLLAEELSAGRRAFGISIYALAGSMGAGLGLIILPLAERGDDMWRILFGLTALGLLVLPVLNRFLSESRAYVPQTKSVGYSDIVNSGSGRYFWTLAAIAFCIAAFSSPAFDFVLERMINDLGWTSGSTTVLLVVASGLGTIGLIVGGKFADQVGRRITGAIALGIGLIGGVGFYFVSSGPLLALTVFLGTFGATMLTPAFAAQRSELFPTSIRASAAGFITNAGIIGSIAGFAIGALVVDSIGLPSTIAVLAVGLLVAAWLILRLPETKGKDLVHYTEDVPAGSPVV